MVGVASLIAGILGGFGYYFLEKGTNGSQRHCFIIIEIMDNARPQESRSLEMRIRSS